MDVNNESQSQVERTKVCNSCKRSLPRESYGILRSSSSGFNPTCFECRRYLRNQSYHKGKFEGDVFPLMAHNKKLLKTYAGRPDELYALNLVNNEHIRIVCTRTKDTMGFKIFDQDNNVVNWLLGSSSLDFEEIALATFFKLRIRILCQTDTSFYTY